MTLRGTSSSILLLAVLFFASQLQAEDYLKKWKGEIPIIVTAPHGGDRSAGLDQREEPNGDLDCLGGGWQDSSDAGSFQLAEEIVNAITDEFGSSPYYVMAEIKRDRIDFNRSFAERDFACCCDGGASHWNDYHNTIQDYIREIERDYLSCGLLLDIHGFGGSSNQHNREVVVGTGQDIGDTLPHRSNQFIYGSDGFAYKLYYTFGASLGLDVIPVSSNDSRYADKRGSYTVCRYSGLYSEYSGNDFDSIQLEFGPRLRDSDNRRDVARAVAKALHHAWQNNLSLCRLDSSLINRLGGIFGSSSDGEGTTMTEEEIEESKLSNKKKKRKKKILPKKKSIKKKSTPKSKTKFVPKKQNKKKKKTKPASKKIKSLKKLPLYK